MGVFCTLLEAYLKPVLMLLGETEVSIYSCVPVTSKLITDVLCYCYPFALFKVTFIWFALQGCMFPFIKLIRRKRKPFRLNMFISDAVPR